MEHAAKAFAVASVFGGNALLWLGRCQIAAMVAGPVVIILDALAVTTDSYLAINQI